MHFDYLSTSYLVHLFLKHRDVSKDSCPQTLTVKIIFFLLFDAIHKSFTDFDIELMLRTIQTTEFSLQILFQCGREWNEIICDGGRIQFIEMKGASECA